VWCFVFFGGAGCGFVCVVFFLVVWVAFLILFFRCIGLRLLWGGVFCVLVCISFSWWWGYAFAFCKRMFLVMIWVVTVGWYGIGVFIYCAYSLGHRTKKSERKR